MSALTVNDAIVLLKESFAERDAAYQRKFDAMLERMNRRDETFDRMQERFTAADEKFERMQKRFTAADEKFDRMQKRADEKFERIQQLTGSFKLNLGEIIEIVMMPKLRAEVNKCGHEFHVISPNKRYEKKDGSSLAEIDLLLENGDEVMAIEIKSNCKDKDIERHLERLEKLRNNEDITGVKGKVIYAAVAVVSIKEDVRDLALGHGMYVITVREEEDRVDIIQPTVKGRW